MYQKYLVLATIVATYVLIVWGAYLTAGDWGAACGVGTASDWPACNGSYAIPLNNYGALVEYIHRTLSVIATVLLLVSNIAVWRMSPRPFKPAMLLALSMVLLVIQILLGAVVVNTNLNAVITAAHLANATALFGIMVIAGVLMFSKQPQAAVIQNPSQ
ncbi:MAG: COX15/CtaA family protein [Conexivisphaerales archaeon]